MAAGDPIPGTVRIMKVTQGGHNMRVAGPYTVASINAAALNESLFLNVRAGEGRAPFGAANIRRAPQAKAKPGEQFIVQTQSNVAGASIDVDADEYEIDLIAQDMNNGDQFDLTLSVGDNELVTDPAAVTNGWATFFQYTVPDRLLVGIKGRFKAVPVEA